MKKRFNFKQRKGFLIFAFILIIILIAGVIVNAIDIAGLKGLNLSLLPVFSLCFCLILILFILLAVFNTHYTLSDKRFKFVIGFLWSSKDYDDILLLREVRSKGILIMYFKRLSKGEEYIEHMVINIKPEAFDEFISSMKDKNDSISYELFEEYRNGADGEDV